MFSGIIESLGEIQKIEKDRENYHFTIKSDFTSELYIDQSIAHNGTCLTVVAIDGDNYQVTAINETMIRTNLGQLKVGDLINLERAVKGDTRMDGHMVQGHVDSTVTCTNIEDADGSYIFKFSLADADAHLVVEKGSICINGVSLTVVDAATDYFTVAIIPYTYEHTNFRRMRIGDSINIEYDIIGKYISKYLSRVGVDNLTKFSRS